MNFPYKGVYNDQYKANREAPPDELIPQFDLVKEVVESFNVPNVGLPGYEADDCIGTLAKQFEAHLPVKILTGDHDSLQLLSDRIHVILMNKGQGNYTIYSPEMLWEEKQLRPEQVIDLKGLMGDSSDNYPGVKGIGEKTALKLLQEHQSIEGILEQLPKLTKGIQKKIETNLEMLHLSRDLARIRHDVPLQCRIEECDWSFDSKRVRQKFEELEFKGLLHLLA